MPIYEYECDYCGNRMERVFSISARPSRIDCDNPTCRNRKSARLIISRSFFRLCGQGWAKDNYAKGKK